MSSLLKARGTSTRRFVPTSLNHSHRIFLLISKMRIALGAVCPGNRRLAPLPEHVRGKAD